MTPIEEAIRKILPVNEWRKLGSQYFTNELESLIPALVEMVERKLAERDVIAHKQGFDAGFEGAELAAFERERKYVSERNKMVTQERERAHADLNAALAQRTREAAEHVPWDYGKCTCGEKWRTKKWEEEDYGKQWSAHILALIKSDESAALAEHDRRVRLEEAEDWYLYRGEWAWGDKRLAALRAGEEKQP